jgi:hypothetical protein
VLRVQRRREAGPGAKAVRGWLRCLVRGWHEPKCYLLGGFRCASCGKAGGDLDDFGFLGQGYVSSHLRTTYDRSRRTVTREAW